MLLVDRCCRRPYIQMEPNFATLFTLCRNLDGYRPADAERRREVAAKILTSLIQVWRRGPELMEMRRWRVLGAAAEMMTTGR